MSRGEVPVRPYRFSVGGEKSKADSGNCKGITLLSTIDISFRKILDDRVGVMLKRKKKSVRGKQALD